MLLGSVVARFFLDRFTGCSRTGSIASTKFELKYTSVRSFFRVINRFDQDIRRLRLRWGSFLWASDTAYSTEITRSVTGEGMSITKSKVCGVEHRSGARKPAPKLRWRKTTPGVALFPTCNVAPVFGHAHSISTLYHSYSPVNLKILWVPSNILIGNCATTQNEPRSGCGLRAVAAFGHDAAPAVHDSLRNLSDPIFPCLMDAKYRKMKRPSSEIDWRFGGGTGLHPAKRTMWR